MVKCEAFDNAHRPENSGIWGIPSFIKNSVPE